MWKLNNRLAPILQSRKRFPVQLGAGTFTTGALADADMDAALEAFHEIAQTGRDQNLLALPAVATSAIREASNCNDFLARVHAETGIELKAITGEEEARLAARGVSISTSSNQGNLIIDMGGGSTEIIKVLPEGQMTDVVSLPLGAVRLAEHVGMPACFDKDALSRMMDLVQETISKTSLKQFLSPPPATCIGGTACALASAVRSRGMAASDVKVQIVDIEETMTELARMTVSSISRTIGTDNSRAQLIIPGAYILTGILRHLQVKEFAVSDAGVREGLVSEYLQAATS